MLEYMYDALYYYMANAHKPGTLPVFWAIIIVVAFTIAGMRNFCLGAWQRSSVAKVHDDPS